MIALWQDYLALPETRFLINHWQAAAVVFVIGVAVMVIVDRRRRA